ncbi:hypothetical protein BOTBODRAFT_563759 [Botryobasidium botryosum FD-172 SS1]|uniref:Zn(2)-C6 fungal-type domain-containing protein n=1 Tax=Botryobasidium botryosum (strain FD-172 SS1) TaxID=930990 RepID=A0A067MA99_BOTB1|nr:hypothetical protein BOTBODRAFT_563759 [Botryobasidium botryosum FD-172 SS1]
MCGTAINPQCQPSKQGTASLNHLRDLSLHLGFPPNMDNGSVLVLPPGSACLMCRKRKKRCDAKKPICGPCIKNKTSDQCSYITRQMKKSLEDRVIELEMHIRDLEVSQSSRIAPRKSVSLLAYPLDRYSDTSTRPSPRSLHGLAGPLDTPASLRDPFAGLLGRRQMLTNLRDSLVKVFIKVRWHYFLEWNIPRFWSAYGLPPSHPESLHPALLDAMCLLGCFHTRGAHTYENLFYARLQRSLCDSLANADRLHDFMRASILGGLYCRLRQRIDSYVLHSSNAKSLLSPLRDLVDLGDRVHTWWGLYAVDRISSLVLGTRAVIPIDQEFITTMLPCPLEEYANGAAARATDSYINPLRTHSAELTRIIGTHSNVHTFRAISMAMLHQAAIISRDEGADRACDILASIDDISQLINAMISYRARVCPTFSRAREYEDDGHDATLIFALSMAYAALIQILNRAVGKDAESWTHRLATARSCIALGIEVREIDSSLLHALAHVSWCSSYEILAWEMIKFEALGDTEAAAATRVELDGAMDLIRWLVQEFDAIRYSRHIQNLVRFDIHTAELDRWRGNS